jgi:hypothetical protein
LIEEIQKSALSSNLTGAPKFLSVIYRVALVAMGTLALALLIHDGKKLGILLALVTCAGIMFAGPGSQRASDSTNAAPPSHHLLPALVIGLVTFAIYFPTLQIYFLSDDFGCLHAFHQPSLHQFLAMFHTDLAQVVEGETGQEIRPFYALFFMMGYKFFGLHPFGYHLVEVFLHIFNALLVYGLANAISRGRPWRACAAALFFSVHPAHAWAVSWITGAPAELLHTFFYLGAFLSFVLFRLTNERRYLALAVASFAACLVAKEMTVTLPLMLLAYDGFRKFALRSNDHPAISAGTERQAVSQLLTYTPFGLLLIVYFAWRRYVFAHVLGENFWAESLGMGANGSGVGHYRPLDAAIGVIRYLLSHHADNLRNLLLASPAIPAGIALGIVAAFAIGLWRRRSQDRSTMAWVVFFGLVWYLIADLPLLVASFEPRHLYLVAVGPCIAAAFVIFPEEETAHGRLAPVRFAAAAVLIAIFAAQLWSENSKIRRQGETSAATVAQIVALGPTLSPEAIVVIPIRQPGLLPFSLQVPFATSDFYSRLRVIEYPDLCDCPFPRWKEKTRRILEAIVTEPNRNAVDMELLSWNERTQSIDLVRSVASSAAIRDAVMESTSGLPDALGSIDAVAGTRLMDALVRISSGKK